MIGLSDIKETLSAHRLELKQKFQVKEIGVFGSYATASQKQTSDVDILVEFDKVPGLLKFLELQNHLSDLLGIDVDLVRKEAIREELKDHILQSAVAV